MSIRRLTVLILIVASMMRSAPALAEPPTQEQIEQFMKMSAEFSARREKEDEKWTRLALALAGGFSLSKIASYKSLLPGAKATDFAPQAAAGGTTDSLRDHLSVMFQFSYSQFAFGNFGTFSTMTYMGGLRYWLKPQTRFVPYVQGLVGIERGFEENALAFSPAGGIIFPLQRLGVSAQVGYRRAAYEGAGANAVYVQGGIVIPLK